jgi:hypothetical protein
VFQFVGSESVPGDAEETSDGEDENSGSNEARSGF